MRLIYEFRNFYKYEREIDSIEVYCNNHLIHDIFRF